MRSVMDRCCRMVASYQARHGGSAPECVAVSLRAFQKLGDEYMAQGKIPFASYYHRPNIVVSAVPVVYR